MTKTAPAENTLSAFAFSGLLAEIRRLVIEGREAAAAGALPDRLRHDAGLADLRPGSSDRRTHRTADALASEMMRRSY